MKKSIIFITLLTFVTTFLYRSFTKPSYLTFSDAAKYANIGKNLYTGKGFYDSFSYFGPAKGLPKMEKGLFPANGIQPVFPYFLSLMFRILGVSDFSVILSSVFFYVLLIISVYLLGKELFSQQIGIFSAIAVIFNASLLDYATQGGTETVLMFEIVSGFLFIFKSGKWRILGYLMMILMYLTRPHGIIYIVVLGAMDIFICSKKTISIYVKLILFGIAILIINNASSTLGGKYFVYPILGRTVNSFLQFSPQDAGNVLLRGWFDHDLSRTLLLKTIFTKIFYNLYNFYKLLPQILSPYLFAFYLISIFIESSDKKTKILKWGTAFSVMATFFATAISIPFFRYLHPVLPLIYIFSIHSLVYTVSRIRLKRPFIVSLLLILFFCVGQTLGTIFLDSRFINSNLENHNKPPVYVILSQKLKELTSTNDIVITNLDTWGSWYGDRITVWFPLLPDQLQPEPNQGIADAIFITSYKMDDANYYMGDEWKQILNNPQKPKNKFISDNYIYRSSIDLSPEENYSKESIKAVLLVKK